MENRGVAKVRKARRWARSGAKTEVSGADAREGWTITFAPIDSTRARSSTQLMWWKAAAAAAAARVANELIRRADVKIEIAIAIVLTGYPTRGM